MEVWSGEGVMMLSTMESSLFIDLMYLTDSKCHQILSNDASGLLWKLMMPTPSRQQQNK